jgi:hypothetical protein
MSKTESDYSNTIFYKIVCKDTTITDLYVGHTTNFVQRKYSHKQNCNNPKANNYKCKLYNIIRLNGGWENWRMEIIAFHNCSDQYEARKKEQEYFLKLNATLNSIQPLPKSKLITVSYTPSPNDETNECNSQSEIIYNYYPKHMCSKCNVKCSSLYDYKKHILTKKHISSYCDNEDNNILADNNSYSFQDDKLYANINTQLANAYTCIRCNYHTDNKKDYNKHTNTAKHIKLSSCNQPLVNRLYICNCGKTYKHASSLCKHRKSCLFIPSDPIPTTENSNISTKLPNNDMMAMIFEYISNKNNDKTLLTAELLKQNDEFKELLINQNKQLFELVQKIGTTDVIFD